MELQGFKSFSDRTEVHLPPGITAVVGPNGCGKSNIGDAINWVLGEQSAKQLRGQQMADVIFAGSESRKAVGMAEVSLHFAGAEGMPQAENGKVAVTRRLFRDGESEYLLNGQRARLKDIQDLLREARVGARTYATIEQGKIDMVLNAKPRDRRALIEDAAGVSGYKHKRRLAEMKLEGAQANLLRVNDILVEVTRQIRTLKRQAAKARRYRRLREELREKELLRFARRALALDEALARAVAAELASRQFEAEAAATVATLEESLVADRETLAERTATHRSDSERLHQIDLTIDRAEAVIRASRERGTEALATEEHERSEAARIGARHEATLERARRQRALVDEGRQSLDQLAAALQEGEAALASAEIGLRELRAASELSRRSQIAALSRATEARNRVRYFDEALERATTRRVRLETEQGLARESSSRIADLARTLAEDAAAHPRRLDSLGATRATAEFELAAAREELAAGVAELAQAREAEQSARARLETLESFEARFAGVSDGVRSLLGGAAAAGIRTQGVAADWLETGEEFEAAAEAYLKPLLSAVILDGDDDAERAAELLEREGAGRTWLISRGQPVGATAVGCGSAAASAMPEALFADPRVVGRLSERVAVRTAANGALAGRIGEAVIVRDLATALEWHRRLPGLDYLTTSGQVVYASGIVCAGSGGAVDRGLLAHDRRTREARADVETTSRRVAISQQRVDAARAEVDHRGSEHQRNEVEFAEAQRAGIEIELRLARSTDESQRSDRQAEVLAAEIESIVEELDRLGTSRASAIVEVADSEHGHGQAEAELAQLVSQGEESERTTRQAAEEVARQRADLAARHERVAGLTADAERIEREEVELREALASASVAIEAARKRGSEALALRTRTEAELAGLSTDRESLARQNADTAAEIEGFEADLTQREIRLRDSRAELDTRREAGRATEIERARADAERGHLDDLCRQELGGPAAEALAAAGEAAAEVDAEALEGDVTNLRQRIEEIGPVNMTAIDEFTELETRHAFLTTQREDIDRSTESLRESIRRINRQSREQFSEAFESIRLSFQEIYRVLFNGGRADLRLEEAEDVLEAGIEIMAQPPGKRLASVQLLSGGEKALSAVALLFAIFRYQPSPFCLLDEVDAALDDANVARFARMVREYATQTQFILITHNKLSMEAADLMYGVTMQEPGVSRLVSLQLQ